MPVAYKPSNPAFFQFRFIRRTVRVLTPSISAACHQVICFAIARMITSCTFIARSTAAARYCLSTTSTSGGFKASDPLRSKADN
jgi:hypothetical protein